MAKYRRRPWQKGKSAWPYMRASELYTVIASAAARERNKSVHARTRHRRCRLEALAMYRRRFGDSPSLKRHDGVRLAPLENLWLPHGYARWKAPAKRKRQSAV